jgi:hypothetical protein
MGDMEKFRLLQYTGSSRRTYGKHDCSRDWFFTREKFDYLDPKAISQYDFGSILLLRIIQSNSVNIKINYADGQPVVPIFEDDSLSAQDAWMRDIIELGRYFVHSNHYWTRGGIDCLKILKRKGIRALVSESVFERAMKKDKLTKVLRRSILEERKLNGWRLFVVGNCTAGSFDFKDYMMNVDPVLLPSNSVAEMYLGDNSDAPETAVGSVWRSILRERGIPFDMKMRSEKFRCVYDELSKYM